MSVDIGPKIGIEGERKFRNDIAQVNQALKTLAAEGKAVTSAFDAETSAEKRTAAQTDVLNRQIETQKDKLALLEKGLRESAKKFGEADTRTMKWQQAVHEATATLNQMERELRGTDETVEDTAEAMGDAGEAAKGWADVMKGQLLADAIKAGLAKLAELATTAAKAMYDASIAGAAYADDILTLATTTGLSTEALQQYKYMADLVDVSLETITGSMTKLTSTMNKARDGEGAAAEIFQELGISVTGVDGQLRDVQSVFTETIEALSKIDNETERDAKSMTLFGKSAKELNSLMAAGSDTIASLGKEAKATGYVLTGSALAALGKQQDAMDRLDKKAEALRNQFSAKLAPSMTKAINSMVSVLNNPRVQRALDVIANGIGGIIEKTANLAERSLPGLFSVMSLGDVRLKTFTDEELALAASIDESRAAYEESMQTYRDSAVTIMGETKRIQDLWKELQTLADESGNVQEADTDRANYILSELNKALGTEYELNDGILKQYRDMQEEIDNLIYKRQAEALIAAGSETFAEQAAGREEALRKAGEAKDALDAAERELAEARKKRDEAERAWLEYDGESDKLLRAYNKEIGKVKELETKVEELRGTYNTAAQTAQEYYSNVDKWERAQIAAANGNYREVVRILSDEFGATVDFYKRKKELSDQDREDLKKKVKDQEVVIAEYKRNLEKGLTGFSNEGLAELQAYVTEAQKILDGEYVASQWLEGMKRGLNNQAKLREVEDAAKKAPEAIVYTTRTTLSIQSPSKVAQWIGRMWDDGLIKGQLDHLDQVRRASEQVADAFTDPITGSGISDLAYTPGVTTAPIGTYNTTNSATNTRIGSIVVQVQGAGAVDEDVLAQRVAVQLTRELQRAQRGGRT